MPDFDPLLWTPAPPASLGERDVWRRLVETQGERDDLLNQLAVEHARATTALEAIHRLADDLTGLPQNRETLRALCLIGAPTLRAD